MKNTGSGGAEGSSSNPNPPQQPDQSSPRRGGGNTSSPNAERTSPQGRGWSSSTSSLLQSPPVMDCAGNTGFSAYRPQPQGQFPRGSSGGAAGASGNVSGSGFVGAQAIPVGGSGGGYAAGVGGVEIPIIRKRVRECAPPAPGGGPAPERGNPFQCSVCGKPFMSAKALFGHMRSHPDRGWKGAFPPPSFRAEDEFADVPYLNRDPASGGGGGVQEEAAGGEEAQGGEDGGDGATGQQTYKVPDLNYSPPQDSDADA
ncbi:Uncharacterized protein Adt_26143 [Abeliophyllum distichum]|uniref:C2H2-type domain-containing protein n=1 Tax=Abeliophyllum distichum TaxID=126358 RepID=A0ABD1RQ37_9LAMI